MQHISKKGNIVVLKQMWLTKVLFFIRLSKGTKPWKRQFKKLPKISRHFYNPGNKSKQVVTLTLHFLWSSIFNNINLFLKSPIAAFNQYILKHGTYNHQNTFSPVPLGQVSFLGVCFEVRKKPLSGAIFFRLSVRQFVCSFVLSWRITGEETFSRIFVIFSTGVPKIIKKVYITWKSVQG
jgi:hypothetical protein